MPLHSHLHLLVPSSTPNTLLEARLYLPFPSSSSSATLRISRTYSSIPSALSDLTKEETAQIRLLGVERLITASHPWGRLGGTMLDPVIAQHLVAAVYQPNAPETSRHDGQVSKRTAVMTYNVRGVGRSQGSSPWLGLGKDPEDFAAMEAATIQLLGEVKEVRRAGYSWGSLAAVHAATPASGIQSTLLISPALTPFRLLSILHRPFVTALAAVLSVPPPSIASLGADDTQRGTPVWMIYGTEDQFTGVGGFRAVLSDLQGQALRGWEVEGADHFFRGEMGEELQGGIRAWLQS